MGTRRVVSMGRTVTFFAGLGTGLAIENYSNQLSAPYIIPATVPVQSKPLLITDNYALPVGKLIEAVKSLASSSDEKPAEKPVEVVVEEPAQQEPEEAAPQAESVVEAVLESVEKSAENIEQVINSEVVEEVKVDAEKVVEIAEEVE